MMVSSVWLGDWIVGCANRMDEFLWLSAAFSSFHHADSSYQANVDTTQHLLTQNLLHRINLISLDKDEYV